VKEVRVCVCESARARASTRQLQYVSVCVSACLSAAQSVCPSVGRSVDGASGTDPVTVRIESRYGYRIIITVTFFTGMFSSFIMCECMCVRVRACACVCVRVRACVRA
jgi:hypothetical protein